jgi:hypothetical protein
VQNQNVSLAPGLTASGVKKLVPQAQGISLGTDLVCELVLLFLFFQRKERQGEK